MEELLCILFVTAVIVALVTGWWRMNNYCSSLEKRLTKSGRESKSEHRRRCEKCDCVEPRIKACDRRYNKPKYRSNSRDPKSPTEITPCQKREKSGNKRYRKPSTPDSDVETLTRNELVAVKKQLNSVCSKIDQILK